MVVVEKAKKFSQFDIKLAVYLLLRGVKIDRFSISNPDQLRNIITYLSKKPEGSNKTRLEILKDISNLINNDNDLQISFTNFVEEPFFKHKLPEQNDPNLFAQLKELNLIKPLESTPVTDNLPKPNFASPGESDYNMKEQNLLAQASEQSPNDLLRPIEELFEVKPDGKLDGVEEQGKSTNENPVDPQKSNLHLEKPKLGLWTERVIEERRNRKEEIRNAK